MRYGRRMLVSSPPGGVRRGSGGGQKGVRRGSGGGHPALRGVLEAGCVAQRLLRRHPLVSLLPLNHPEVDHAHGNATCRRPRGPNARWVRYIPIERRIGGIWSAVQGGHTRCSAAVTEVSLYVQILRFRQPPGKASIGLNPYRCKTLQQACNKLATSLQQACNKLATSLQ
eukprot:408200-Prorocentrum_minimum.AAC.1